MNAIMFILRLLGFVFVISFVFNANVRKKFYELLETFLPDW